MIKLIILFASCFCLNPNAHYDICPDPTHTIENHGDCPLEHVVHSQPGGTGGETGGGPKPPAPPPPGSGN